MMADTSLCSERKVSSAERFLATADLRNALFPLVDRGTLTVLMRTNSEIFGDVAKVLYRVQGYESHMKWRIAQTSHAPAVSLDSSSTPRHLGQCSVLIWQRRLAIYNDAVRTVTIFHLNSAAMSDIVKVHEETERQGRPWDIRVISLSMPRNLYWDMGSYEARISLTLFVRHLKQRFTSLLEIRIAHSIGVIRGGPSDEYSCAIHLDAENSDEPGGRIDWTFEHRGGDKPWNVPMRDIDNFTSNTSVALAWHTLIKWMPGGFHMRIDDRTERRAKIDQMFSAQGKLPQHVSALNLVHMWYPDEIQYILNQFATRSAGRLDTLAASSGMPRDDLITLLASPALADNRVRRLKLGWADRYAEFPSETDQEPTCMHLDELMPLIAMLPASLDHLDLGCIVSTGGPTRIVFPTDLHVRRRHVGIRHVGPESPDGDINRAFFISRFLAPGSGIKIAFEGEHGYSGVDYTDSVDALYGYVPLHKLSCTILSRERADQQRDRLDPVDFRRHRPAQSWHGFGRGCSDLLRFADRRATPQDRGRAGR